MGLAFATVALLGLGCGLTSCNNDDDNKIELNFLEGYGPLPIGRGEVLTFLGKDLSSVQAVEFQNGTIVDVTRIDKTKFTITVPDNVAPGVLKLHLSNGSIYETVTPCKFNEPIELIAATPSTIKVGDELTITGKYLYQARSVKFAGDVVVSLDDSLPEKRTIRNYDNTNDSVITVNVVNPYKVSREDGAIVVKVPATAISGKVGLNDYDDYDFFSDELVLDIIKPSVSSFDDKVYRPGTDVVSLSGKDLDLVKSVKFDGAEVSKFDTQTESALSFALPATAKPGTFSLVTESGVAVPVADIQVLAPTAEVAAKAFLGSELTISGTNLDLVKEVKVGDATISKPAITATSISFVIPDNATDGIKLIPANGISVDLAFDAVPATIDESMLNGDNKDQLNFNAGGDNEITGENLTKITDIVVGGYSVLNLKAEDKKIKFTVPAEVKQAWYAGGAQLVFVNGEQKTYNAWVNGASYPFVSSMPKSAIQGSSIMVNGGNLKGVTSVTIGGVEQDFSVLDDSRMFIQVSVETKEGEYNIVVNDAKSYDKIKITKTEPIVLWEDKAGSTPDWTETRTVAAELAAGLTASCKVIVHLDIDQDATTKKGYGYLTMVKSGWGTQWQENLSKGADGVWNSEVVFQFADKVTSYKQVPEEIEDPLSIYNGGFFICGGEATYKIVKITLEY